MTTWRRRLGQQRGIFQAACSCHREQRLLFVLQTQSVPTCSHAASTTSWLRVGRAGNLNCSQTYDHVSAAGRMEQNQNHKSGTSSGAPLCSVCSALGLVGCCTNTKSSEPFVLMETLQDLNYKHGISWSNSTILFHSAVQKNQQKSLLIAQNPRIITVWRNMHMEKSLHLLQIAVISGTEDSNSTSAQKSLDEGCA